MNRTILVTGGTGTLGQHVVWRLLEDEHEVRVLSRHDRPPSDRTPTRWTRGDLRSGKGLDAALRGVDAVVHCATTRGRADLAATRHLLAAARRAGGAHTSPGGGPHLVYVSIVGVDRVPALSYYRTKLACERLVEESGMPWTTLRATQFHEFLAAAVRAQRRLPVTVTLGGGVRFQPVAAREVGERLAALAVDEPAGHVADMGGPEVRTAEELTRVALRIDGRRRPVLPVRPPGRVVRALREGALLTPEHAEGVVTFEEYLDRGAPAGG
ncbi:SDR family oxidoreductase [Streptomyces sp. 4N509B]|uniref:SDR family oxidoreductase n=1 Tax=Streptomyces sp. 4N509B TaxID=3457413 RepID=UPI003FCF7997